MGNIQRKLKYKKACTAILHATSALQFANKYLKDVKDSPAADEIINLLFKIKNVSINIERKNKQEKRILQSLTKISEVLNKIENSKQIELDESFFKNLSDTITSASIIAKQLHLKTKIG